MPLLEQKSLMSCTQSDVQLPKLRLTANGNELVKKKKKVYFQFSYCYLYQGNIEQIQTLA